MRVRKGFRAVGGASARFRKTDVREGMIAYFVFCWGFTYAREYLRMLGEQPSDDRPGCRYLELLNEVQKGINGGYCLVFIFLQQASHRAIRIEPVGLSQFNVNADYKMCGH